MRLDSINVYSGKRLMICGWVGQSDRGIVFEQNLILSADDIQCLLARRIKVCLEELLSDEDKETFILTNLPSDSAVGTRYSRDGCFFTVLIAQIYRKRWKLKTLFQVLTENLCCEINTLGYLQSCFVCLLHRFRHRSEKECRGVAVLRLYKSFG